MSHLDEDANADGRRARRDRNKYAVVDAYLELVRAGAARPSVADVAERSGMSHRSVFRYFADSDELVRAAIHRQHAFVQPLLALTVGPGTPIQERIERFIERRMELFEVLAPVARLARSLAPLQPIISAELTTGRQLLRSQIDHLFRTELDALAVDAAAEVLAALDVVCSFEAVELLRVDQGLSGPAAAATIGRSMRGLLFP